MPSWVQDRNEISRRPFRSKTRVLLGVHESCTVRALASALSSMEFVVTRLADVAALRQHVPVTSLDSARRRYAALIVTEWLPACSGLDLLELGSPYVPSILLADSFEPTTYARARKAGVRYVFAPNWEVGDVLTAVMFATSRHFRNRHVDNWMREMDLRGAHRRPKKLFG